MRRILALIACLGPSPCMAQSIMCSTNLGITTCTQNQPYQPPNSSSADGVISGLLRGTGFGQTSNDVARQNLQNQLLQQQIELQRQQIEMNRKLLEQQKALEQ